MKQKIFFLCIMLSVTVTSIKPQKQIFVFDPIEVSQSFQSSFRLLSPDRIITGNSIDTSIFTYDALFLFIGHQYTLTQTEGDLLISYLQTDRPLYIFAWLMSQQISQLTFWNFIGIEGYVELPLYVLVDSVTGVSSTFSEGVKIDTTFWSSHIPNPVGNLVPVLRGIGTPMNIDLTYVSGIASINVIVDQFNQIYHPEFLSRVIQHFGLNLRVTNISFFPETDTAWIYGGCVGPDVILYNKSFSSIQDTIIIEPGPNSVFFYFDSLGNQISVEKYYFVVTDIYNQYKYEIWLYPKLWPPFDPVLIPFDSVFSFYQNLFDIQLLVKHNEILVDSLSQLFRAEWGLNVENDEILPENYALIQNYPNPFNPSTKIEFRIADFGFVTLKVYDVLGNEIVTLVNEEKQPGIYEVEFSAKGESASGGNVAQVSRPEISSGIYFYQLRAGDFIETKKMVLLK